MYIHYVYNVYYALGNIHKVGIFRKYPHIEVYELKFPLN